MDRWGFWVSHDTRTSRRKSWGCWPSPDTVMAVARLAAYGGGSERTERGRWRSLGFWSYNKHLTTSALMEGRFFLLEVGWMPLFIEAKVQILVALQSLLAGITITSAATYCSWRADDKECKLGPWPRKKGCPLGWNFTSPPTPTLKLYGCIVCQTAK